MRLHIAGSGTCEPSPERTPACYLLEGSGAKIIIDPGPGAVNRIAAMRLDPFAIDAILVTHFHLDHISDLLYWLFAYKYCDSKPKKEVSLYGPPGFASFFKEISAPFSKWILDKRYDIAIVEMDEPRSIRGLDFSARPMSHSPEAIGYRFFSDGKTLAYSGDTGPCDQLVELARGADALLVEVSKPDGWEGRGHMRPKDVATAGTEAGVPKIVATHISPTLDADALSDAISFHGYEGEVIVAQDRMVIEL